MVNNCVQLVFFHQLVFLDHLVPLEYSISLDRFIFPQNTWFLGSVNSLRILGFGDQLVPLEYLVSLVPMVSEKKVRVTIVQPLVSV